MELTERERVLLLMMRGYGDRVRSYREVQLLFNGLFPERETEIPQATVVKTVQRFELTGSIKSRVKPGRPKSETNEEKYLDILQNFVEDPLTSLRKVAIEQEVHYTYVRNVLKENKFKPYKNYKKMILIAGLSFVKL